MTVAWEQLNLLVAWLWVCLGFLSGMLLGLFFHKDNWLGGYGSLKRRMYRLGHISFFGLGAVNLLFWLTVKDLPTPSLGCSIASCSFIVGALTMPLCCVMMAHFPKLHSLFAVPVASLLLAGVLTLTTVIRSPSLLGNKPLFSLTQPDPKPSSVYQP